MKRMLLALVLVLAGGRAAAMPIGLRTAVWSVSSANWHVGVASPPAAPTDVRATTTRTDGIQISWSGGSGASFFNVWRGTSDIRSSASIIGTCAEAPFFDDSSPSAETVCYYWIEAVNSEGSTFSSSASGARKSEEPDLRFVVPSAGVCSDWETPVFLASTPEATSGETSFGQGQAIYPHFVCMNDGKTAASAPFVIRWGVAERGSNQWVAFHNYSFTNSLGAGRGRYWHSYAWPGIQDLPPGDYTYWVVLDANGDVAEADESNNVARVDFTVEVARSSVTFDFQGGTGGSASVTATYGSAMPAIAVPTRAGYSFGGYYTAENGRGTQYYNANGASARNWDRTVDTTLYAKWRANGVDLAFFVPASGFCRDWDESVFLATTPEATTGKTVFEQGATIYPHFICANAGTEDASTPFVIRWGVAKFGANQYVSFVDHRFTNTIEVDDYWYWHSYAWPGIQDLPPGDYTYWVVLDNGNALAEADENNNVARVDFTIEAARSSVTLDRQGGSGGTASVTATYGSAMPAIAVPTRAGYSFGGYWTGTGGTGTQYYDANGASARKWNRTAATTLYALWLAPRSIFRFYSKNYKGHFFTIDEAEKQNLIDTNPNWRYEGVAYRAFEGQASGTVALYRFYSKGYRGHFFTIDAVEAETVKTNPNWKYEGVAYYVYPSAVEGTVPVYRFWSKGYRHHFYTIDEAEKDNLIATNPNWKYEGVAFYALPAADASVEAPSSAPAGKGVQRALRAHAAAWTLAAADGAAIAVPGVTEAGGAVVETRADAPDANELAARADTSADPLALRLALPGGAFGATLWSAADGMVADETADGAFVFDLTPNGVWHWLRVRDGDDDAFSVWLKAE